MDRLAAAHELLDGPLDAGALRGNLRDLARVNRWLGGTEVTWRALAPYLNAGATITLLDVGTGSGDLPQGLLRRAGKGAGKGAGLSIVTTEVRPELVRAAAARARARPAFEVREQRDPRRLDAAEGEFDVVHSSLVLHHLEPDEAVAMLCEMGRVARTAVVVNDLDRRRRWWVGAWLMSHLLTGNRYTRHDAPLSVRRAYRPEEVVAMAGRAGLHEVARHWTRPGYRYAIVLAHDRVGST